MHLRTFSKSLAVLAIAVGSGLIVLVCYAFVIRTQAERLLDDLTSLSVGNSTETDVHHLAQRHKWFLVSEGCTDGDCTTIFNVRNRWLWVLKLEPLADFTVEIYVKAGTVSHISASLIRYMEIFPTFGASAGIVDEYSEFPDYFHSARHYAFPTPVGKPYLRVILDSHASTAERGRAFHFSLRCLVKPGGGCDLPCDYLPLAWQDWKAAVRVSEMFDQSYPKNSRCKP
jgi:hypothetical protein